MVRNTTIFLSLLLALLLFSSPAMASVGSPIGVGASIDVESGTTTSANVECTANTVEASGSGVSASGKVIKVHVEYSFRTIDGRTSTDSKTVENSGSATASVSHTSAIIADPFDGVRALAQVWVDDVLVQNESCSWLVSQP